MSLEFIFDRTAADLSEAETIMRTPWNELTPPQKEAYNAGLRGTYKSSDLNRVETAVEYLAKLLLELPQRLEEYAAELGSDWRPTDLHYNPEDFELTTKTDWGLPDPFSEKEKDRYLKNVRLIRDAMAADMPLPSDMDGLSIQGANDIEAALKAAEENYEKLWKRYVGEINGEIENMKLYSGEAFSGEVSV